MMIIMRILLTMMLITVFILELTGFVTFFTLPMMGTLITVAIIGTFINRIYSTKQDEKSGLRD